MEFKNPLFLWFGVAAGLFWIFDFLKIFQKSQIYFPGIDQEIKMWKKRTIFYTKG
jgi:hypothetical protein